MFFKSNKRKANIDAPFKIEQMLRHLGMLAERIDQAVIITDLAGGIHFANTRWALMHGYRSSAELLGKHISAFYTKDQMKKNINGCLAQAGNAGFCAASAEHLKKDGTTFSTRLKMSAFKNEMGKTEAVLVLAEDLSRTCCCEAKSATTTRHAERNTQYAIRNTRYAIRDEPLAVLPIHQLREIAKMAKRFR